jgi:ABC-type branched-subunit amino acid transport system ATPase component
MTAPTSVAVEVRDLVKQYGPLKAVDDLDLTVPTGGIFGLIGPTGRARPRRCWRS